MSVVVHPAQPVALRDKKSLALSSEDASATDSCASVAASNVNAPESQSSVILATPARPDQPRTPPAPPQPDEPACPELCIAIERPDEQEETEISARVEAPSPVSPACVVGEASPVCVAETAQPETEALVKVKAPRRSYVPMILFFCGFLLPPLFIVGAVWTCIATNRFDSRWGFANLVLSVMLVPIGLLLIFSQAGCPVVRSLCNTAPGHCAPNHTCPPRIGSLGDCAEFLSGFAHCIVLQQAHVGVDQHDRAALAHSRGSVHNLLLEIERKIAATFPVPDGGMRGGRGLDGVLVCSECSAGGGECRCPQRARPSLEALGVDVNELLGVLKLERAFSPDRVLWSGAILW
eukprot:m51a1_g4010 hypothetical protein (349) ;mRNA; f:554983-556698